jgi:hypothetical protein
MGLDFMIKRMLVEARQASELGDMAGVGKKSQEIKGFMESRFQDYSEVQPVIESFFKEAYGYSAENLVKEAFSSVRQIMSTKDVSLRAAQVDEKGFWIDNEGAVYKLEDKTFVISYLSRLVLGTLESKPEKIVASQTYRLEKDSLLDRLDVMALEHNKETLVASLVKQDSGYREIVYDREYTLVSTKDAEGKIDAIYLLKSKALTRVGLREELYTDEDGTLYEVRQPNIGRIAYALQRAADAPNPAREAMAFSIARKGYDESKIDKAIEHAKLSLMTSDYLSGTFIPDIERRKDEAINGKKPMAFVALIGPEIILN